MRVMVCRDRKTAAVIDVLDLAKHKPSPDVLRVFDCAEADLDPVEISALKGGSFVDDILLRDASRAELDARLDELGLTAIVKTLEVDGRVP